MVNNEAQSFLVLSNVHGSYGVAATLAEAVRNCKREGGIRGKAKLSVVAFTCTMDRLCITAGPSLQYEWPLSARAMKFEADL